MSAQIISFKADVNDVTRKMGILGKSISKVEALQKEAITIERQHKRELTNLGSAISKYGADSQEVAKIQNRLNHAQATGAAISDKLAKEEELLAQQAKKAGIAHDELGQIVQATGARLEGYNAGVRNSNGNYKQANSGMRAMRGGMAQLGYQVQDVAVQLQMGQNALLVFGQQGSQVASIFGAKGALLGAVLAVGAALGTALLPELFKTNNHLKELKERLDDATDSFDDLGEAQRAVLITETQKSLETARKELEEYAKTARDFSVVGDILVDEFQDANAEFELQQEHVANLEKTLARLNGELVRDDEAIKDLIESLQEEADTLGYTETQLALYEAASYGASTADRARIESLRASIDEHERLNARLQEAARLREQEAAIEKAVRDMSFRTDRQMLLDSHQEKLDMLRDYYDARLEIVQQGTEAERQLEQDKQNAINVASSTYLSELKDLKAQEIQIYSNLSGAIAANLQQGTSSQRAFVAAQKGLALASAIMNMQVAITSAIASAPFPANLPGIAMATTQGLNSIAAIRAISFDGGGFTGMGARAGGIDGRGGFPAILHPNETVYDHTRGQGGQPINVSFNISTVNAQGFDELLYSRRGQIINMINQAVNNSGRRSIT